MAPASPWPCKLTSSLVEVGRAVKSLDVVYRVIFELVLVKRVLLRVRG